MQPCDLTNGSCFSDFIEDSTLSVDEYIGINSCISNFDVRYTTNYEDIVGRINASPFERGYFMVEAGWLKRLEKLF